MESYWEQTHLLNSDIAIIGGGIVGLSVAASLLERNANQTVRIFERSLLPYGASTRNAGFACFGSLSEILSDIELMGFERTRELIFQRWMGLQITTKRLGAAAIGFESSGGYELIDEADQRLSRCEEINRLVEDFIPNYLTIASDERKNLGIASSGTLIKMNGEGQVNSGLLMKALLNYVSSLGGQILSGADVLRIEKNNGFSIYTKDGSRGEVTFKANRVIICNNAFAKDLIPELDVKPGRGQVFITEPIKDLKFNGNLHLEEGFYYLRNVGDRILFGGGRNLAFENEESFEQSLNAKIQEALEQKLSTILDLNTDVKIAMRWAGIMGFGKTKTPIVTTLSDGTIVAVRMSGMGIALAGYIGEEVADRIE